MRFAILAAAAALALPAAMPAQGATSKETTQTTTHRGDNDADFPWGLLGLLGLAGLLGLKRREPDIHVDARRHPN